MNKLVEQLKDLNAKILKNSIEFKPDWKLFLKRAYVLYDLGNTQNALNDCSQAINLQPGKFQIFFQRGLCYYRLGNYELALQDFVHTNRINPNFSLSYHQTGAIYTYKLNKPYLALECYNKAIQVNPNDANMWNSRGELYRKMLNNFDAAIRDYEKCISLDPRNTHAYCNIGIIFKQIGKHEEAVKMFLKSLELFPDSFDCFVYIGQILHNGTKKYSIAIKYYTKALAIDLTKQDVIYDYKPHNAYFYRGLCYEILNQYELSKNDFKEALKLNPKYDEAKVKLKIVEEKLRVKNGGKIIVKNSPQKVNYVKKNVNVVPKWKIPEVAKNINLNPKQLMDLITYAQIKQFQK